MPEFTVLQAGGREVSAGCPGSLSTDDPELITAGDLRTVRNPKSAKVAEGVHAERARRWSKWKR